MSLNLFSIAGLLLSTTCLILVTIIIFYGKTKLHRIWALFNIAIGIWGIIAFFIGRANSPDTALLLWRLSHIGVILIPVFMFHVVYIICELREKVLLYLIYFQGFLFLFLDLFTDYFIPSVRYFSSSFYFGVPGSPYYLFFIIWIAIIFYAHYRLFLTYRISIGQKRNQILYLFLGTIVGFSGAITNFLPAYKIDLYPFGNFTIPLYCIIVTYAILRHQLMDIKVVIKKSLVFAGMFAFIFGIVVAVTMVITQFLGGANNLFALAVSALIIVFTLRPTETWLINATDKFLFQKKYEYKQIIKAFIDNVVTELNLDTVISSTLKLLDETLHPYTCAVFILNKIQDKYQLYDSLGLEDKNTVFAAESKLVIFLKNRQLPAVIRQINGITGVNPAISAEMATLKATIVLPLMLHSDLIGFISVGKKKSDEDYSKDDLDVLQDLARTESIAVANAQLLTEAAQSERRAAIGTMAAGINHEIGNPLNIINTKIQVFRTAIQRGFYKDKPKEEVMEECVAILDETIKQTERIAEITKKLSNFAKPGKEFKPVIISISQEIENTLGILGHDLELERIKIVKEISAEPNKILADEHETQQILFNIFRNAGQSIEGPGTITIRAFTTPDGKVRIEIEDTGKGISEDKMHRIFEPFFTTKGTKGTGLGLSIVRQLVWKNKGEISFKSKVGVGTTFILEFPKAE